MKKQLKRLTALILVLSMTISLLSSTAWAEELTKETADSAEASMVEVEDEPTEDVADELETQPDESEPTDERESQPDQSEAANEPAEEETDLTAEESTPEKVESEEAFEPLDIPSETEKAEELLRLVETDFDNISTMSVSEDDIPSFSVYNADARINGLEGSGNSLYDIMMGTDMIYQQLAEYGMEETGLYYTSGLWIGCLDSAMENNPKYAYEMILEAYLAFDAESTETQNTLAENAKSFAVDCVFELIGNGLSNAEDEAKAAANIKNQIIALSKEDAAKKLKKAGILHVTNEVLEKAKELAENTPELIDYLSSIASVDETRLGQIAFLKQVRTYVTDNEPLKLALTDIINTYDNVDASSLWLAAKEKTLEQTYKSLIKESWNEIVDRAPKAIHDWIENKGLDTVSKLLGKLGLAAKGMNVLFGSTSTSKDYMSILTIYVIDSEFRSGLQKQRANFLSNPTTENAEAFNTAFDAYREFQIYASATAKQYLYDIINSGLLTKTFAQIFYSENIKTAEELSDICDNQISNRKKISEFTEKYYQIYCGKYNLISVVTALDESQTSTNIPVTGIAFSSKTRTLPLNSQSYSFGEITFSPANATNQDYTVTSSDSSVVSVNNIMQTLTTLKTGTVTLTVTSTDGQFTDTQTVTVVDNTADNAKNYVANGTCGEHLKWTLDSDGVLIISGSGTMENYSEVSSAPWFSYRLNIQKILIQKNVTSIGNYAFYDCRLTSITISNSVTSIGYAAFEDCNNLTSVTIPNSVTSIGSGTFYDCKSLTSITIPNSVTSIGDFAFEGCINLTSVTIPNSVTSIGNEAFYDCKSLTSITIPNSVTSIGNEAFYYCISLTSITIPKSVTSIGDSAFRSCSSLTSVTIPDSVTSIGNEAFLGCSSLTSITIPNSVTSIGEETFRGCASLTSVTIPNSVTSIGNEAFLGCSSLTSITIPNRVTSIDNHTFYNCNSLTSITIPDSVTSIGKYAFYNCKSLKNVYYSGSKSNWSKISIGFYNTCLTNATIHYDSSGSESEHTHSYSAKITTVATCGKAGVRTYTCSCGDSYTESIPATGKHTWDSGKVTKNPSFTATGTKTYTCSVCKTTKTETIAKLTKVALNKATVTLSKTSVAYTGKAQKPTVTVKVNGVTVPSSQYTVSYSNNTKVGTAKVTIKATSKATYISGSVTKTFTITKAANPLTVSPTSKSFTVANCKKKAQTFTIKASKAQGTVSYKSSDTKYVTVSKGKVTVKKGTPKGTYKVTVTAKGNGTYNSGSKTVTITVK